VTTTSRVVPTSVERVWEVLADGWTYPLWVVGATHMRDVDDGWPAVGSRLHHSVGSWPVLLEDTTSVVAADPGRRIELTARAWPFGTARVVIELAPHADGTLVTMGEQAESGPARLLPSAVQGALLRPRNREALARLEALACNRES
jgi:uncharacterized protein YndB with AHSA1/START domain